MKRRDPKGKRFVMVKTVREALQWASMLEIDLRSTTQPRAADVVAVLADYAREKMRPGASENKLRAENRDLKARLKTIGLYMLPGYGSMPSAFWRALDLKNKNWRKR